MKKKSREIQGAFYINIHEIEDIFYELSPFIRVISIDY